MRNGDLKKVKEEVLKRVYVREDLLDKILAIISLIREEKGRNKEKEGRVSTVPRGILFHGPPGTGKTLLMRALSEALGVPRVEISGPEILSEYYGRSERNLRRKFLEAQELAEEKGLSIIFIDELDAIAPRRDVERSGLEPRLVGQLLALMDGLSSAEENVLVIGSTNRPWAIDPALRRPGRFDYEFEFEFPDEEGRKEILKIHCKDLIEGEITEDFLKEIARKTEGFSGADIRLLVMEARIKLEKEGKKLKYPLDDFKKALEESIKKIVPTAMREMSSERISEKTEVEEKFLKKAEEVIGRNKILVIGTGDPAKEFSRAIARLFSKKKGQEVYFTRIPCNIFRTKWFGEGERMLRDHIDRAMKFRPGVILLDHLDSITLSEDYNLAGMISEVLDLLDRVDREEDVICIGAIREDAKEKISSEIWEKFGGKGKEISLRD